MDSLLALASAFWLGVLTSMSPCPLASNIAAVSFLAKEAARPGEVLLSGILYSAGRILTYVGLGVIIAGSLLNIPEVAFFLQGRTNQVLGPVLIITGLFLLGWIRINFTGFAASQGAALRLKSLGRIGSLLLGMALALSFCPVSAGLFFGSLIPLTLQHGAPVSLPFVYGLGTAIPVIAFALVIALGVKGLSRAYERTTVLQGWLRKSTGWIFLLVGSYYVFQHILIPLLFKEG